LGNERQGEKMRKEIVLYNASGEELERFDLMEVENIEYYTNNSVDERIAIFLDSEFNHHYCNFFEIERVED